MKVRVFFSGCMLVLLAAGLTTCSDDTIPEEPEEPFTRLVRNQSVQSIQLNRAIKYAVLLPEGYDTSTATYPVVYLLHGFGDNETAWYTNGSLQYYVDRNAATSVPMIFVMPEGYNSYYINRYNGSYPYMEMFVQELVPEIDRKFRTKADKTQRAVMGYSMGGYGALILPALNPDMFSVSVPLSMSFRTDEQYLAETQGSFDVQWAPNFGPSKGVSGAARLSAYFRTHSPFHFFNTCKAEDFNQVKYFLDCGDDEESLIFTSNGLHGLMRNAGIAHEYRVRSGGHSFDYWKQSYQEALTFISNAVQGVAHPTEPSPATVGELITTAQFTTVEIAGHPMNIMLPVDYVSNTATYPVLYFIHDTAAQDVNDSRIKTFSMLRNAMTATRLYQSVLVEIPAGDYVTHDFMTQVVSFVDAHYRSKSLPANRVVIANGTGGQNAVDVVAGTADLFGDCFLFNATLSAASLPLSEDVFYYLDITDGAASYNQYHTLYNTIRNQQIGYEYRVRQGGESFQDFLNGLNSSFAVMKSSLNN
jgi:S-formylglutathione hydrolase FrmB